VDIADESTLSEINILPDGRVFVFGTSRAVLEVLETLSTPNERLQRLLETVQNLPGAEAVPPGPDGV
jgi:hypothetical protein